MEAATGSYSMAGFNADFIKARHLEMQATRGIFQWSGFNTTLSKQKYYMQASPGTFAMTGLDSTLTKSGASSTPTLAPLQFSLTSSAGGTNLPFSIGQVFRQGDVTAGAVLGADTAIQVRSKATWPDGSLKFALISGRKTLTAGVASVVTMSINGTVSSGSNLTTTDLRTVMAGQTCSIDCETFGSASWATTDFDSPAYSWVSGPTMSSWIYRKAVDAHLSAWIEVRLYLGGAVEILPWVENGTLTTAGANKSANYVFTLGSTQRFSSVIDVKGRTRVPLLSGTGVFSYWLGADPGITPAHNTTYLMSTGMVPTYGWTSPSTGTLNSLLQAYTPNTLAGINSSMGTAGSSAALIPTQQALYLTSGGDARAWRGAMVFGLSGGSWSTHYRDATTNAVPKFSDYPNIWFDAGTPVIPAHTGGSNGTAVTTHQPSYGYLPFMLTGRWWFWEENAFWTFWNYQQARVRSRQGETSFETGPFRNTLGSAGVIDCRSGTYANRGGHWSIRTLAQTFALCPSDHPTYASWKTAWEANADYYKVVFVDGTHSPGWVSPQGFLGDYSSGGTSLYDNGGTNTWWGAGWMSAFGVQAWGFASDLGLDQSATSKANHLAVRNHAYKQVTTRSSDGLSGRYNWRRFGVYNYPLGSDENGLPPETWFTGDQSYANYLAARGVANIPSTPGLTLKDHSTDTDMTVSSTTATDYGAFALGGLAYAVKHAAPGGIDGWARVSGASNFDSGFAGLHNNPEHAIAPPVPSHIVSATAGQWTSIGTNTMTSVAFNYTGWGVSGFATTLQSIMNAWCGGAYDHGTHRLFVNGGGHNDYDGNETYAFNLQTAAWVRLDNPSPYDEDTFSGGAANPLGWNGVYTDNGPQPIHTYDVLSVNPVTGKMYRLGKSGSACLTRIQEFDPALATQQTPGTNRPAWAYKATISWADGHSGVSAWMADEGQFLIGAQDGGTFISFRRYNPTTDTVGSTIAAIPGGFYSGDMAMAYSPTRRLAVCHRTQASANQVLLVNTSANSIALQTITGATLPARVGLEYDPVRDKFMAYTDEGADRRVLYSINPDTWVATQISPSGTIPLSAPAGDYRGIYGRFAYCADYDVFIAVNSVTGGVFVYKPTDWNLA